MYKNNVVGIIEVMPDDFSKENIEEALYKKELLDAVTMQDYTGEACNEIIKEAIKDVLGL